MTISACVLKHRSLIRVRGADKLAFLQGLVSNDMSKLNPEVALFTLLLSPQGRFQYDLIVHQSGDDWFLEVDADRAEALIKRLMIFKLRSQVSFDLTQDQAILSLWGEDVASALELPAKAGASRGNSLWTAMVDPRLESLGARLIIAHSAVDKVQGCLGMTVHDLAAYRRHRYQLGVPEGAGEMEFDRAIPLEWGMDELNAIDWDKGCYMGQELTARTRYRGLVRKRVLPIHAPSSVDMTVPVLKGDQEVGHWVAREGDIGLAMIRVAAIGAELTCDGQVVKLGQPSWMKLPEINDEA